VIVTTAQTSPATSSRGFRAGSGVLEDPVTGSAHCARAVLAVPPPVSDFFAYQASPRGGVVRVRVVGDRVKLGGKAVTVLRGELLSA
jgi:predicted PhzF superfamily epimerase YddE/YHI9